MQSLVRMIAGTFVRSLVYKGMRGRSMTTSVVLALVGAALYVAMSR